MRKVKPREVKWFALTPELVNGQAEIPPEPRQPGALLTHC